MTEIAFFSTDWHSEDAPNRPGTKIMSFGGTFYYRGAMPAMELAKHGWDVHLSWRFDIAPDGHIRTMDTQGEWHDPEIFWSQRWMNEDGDKMVAKARSTGQVCIADLDDGFTYLPKSNIAYHTTDPKNNPKFNREHYWKMLAACDLVTTSTDSLARDMEINHAHAVAVVKNAIDLERWHVHDPGENGMIGWVGGVQWRASDLGVLRPVLPQFLEDFGLPFYHGGDSAVPNVPKAWEQIGIDTERVRVAANPLVSILDYPRLWDPIGLALVPLENHPFNVRKSHLKGLEAAACGIPFIYSSKMPEYDAFGAGIRADNARPKTWRAALETMLDPDVRREEGTRNRKIAEQWDITDRWVAWDEAFRSVVPSDSQKPRHPDQLSG